MKTYAPAGRRFAAFLIDWYVSSLFGSIPVILMQSVQAHEFHILLLSSLHGKQILAERPNHRDALHAYQTSHRAGDGSFTRNTHHTSYALRDRFAGISDQFPHLSDGSVPDLHRI